MLSGLLLLVWWPLITGPPERYGRVTGLEGSGFLTRWLLIAAGLFALSGLVLLLRLWRRPRTPASAGGGKPRPTARP